VNAANKRVLQKVALALQNGLSQTALDLLQKADPKELADQRSPGVAVGGQWALELLLAMGRLEEARDILVPDPDSKKSLDKRVFGAHRLGLPAYQWYEAQLAAACGDYEVADRALGECLGLLETDPRVWPMLAQLDVVPPSYGAQRKGTLGTFSALLVGDLVLQGAKASNLPWQLQFTLLPPSQRLFIQLPPNFPANQRRPPGWPVTLHEAGRFAAESLQPHADLWAVRAWLSLEAGHTSRARKQAEESLARGVRTIGRYRVPRYPSHLLAIRVLELTGGLDQPAPGKR
jgi:hypothetical protein